MNVNDRGTKKWVSIMMPEHVEALERMWEEQERKEKPILDEQQIEENAFKLHGALAQKLEVRVTYFSHYDFLTIDGVIKDIRNKVIFINNEELKFDSIIQIEFVDSIFDDY